MKRTNWIPLAIACVTMLGGVFTTLLTHDRGQAQVNEINAQRLRDSVIISVLTQQLVEARMAHRAQPRVARGTSLPTAAPTRRDSVLQQIEVMSAVTASVPDTFVPRKTALQRLTKVSTRRRK